MNTQLWLDDAAEKVIYIGDAYCGWCYAFSPQLELFRNEFSSQLSFHLVNGGLFKGARKPSLKDFGPGILETNKRITEMTGLTFGPNYQRLFVEEGFQMDSEAAAAGQISLRQKNPKLTFEVFAEMQKSFFVDGRNLSNIDTYVDIANELGLNSVSLDQSIVSPSAHVEVQRDFATVAALGVNSFPTLLYVNRAKVLRLPTSGVSADERAMELRKIRA